MSNYLRQLLAIFHYEDLFLVFISILVGMIIGAEREYHNKTAGLRTIMLVGVGSCIFTLLSIKIGGNNPDRIAANIITGIGFLGAGVIFKDENKINGLTTACTIWVTAALGMAIGSKDIFLAILGTAVVLIVLWNLLLLEKWIDKMNKTVEYKITTPYSESIIDDFDRIFKHNKLRSSVQFKSKSGENLTVFWKLTGSKDKHKMIEQILFNHPKITQLDII